MSLKHYKPSTSQPWNLLRVWTLHRRTGFGATWKELQRDLSDGPQKSIDRIMGGTSRVDGVPDNYAEMSRVIGDSAVASDRPERLAAWWIYQMMFSPNPLRERLAIMWHNHFATSNAKVRNLPLMFDQNETFRMHGSGRFQNLIEATLKQSAMLKWLDGDENRAGQANENLGRETLELFTLGVGNYTEEDVKNASRALTGWSTKENKFLVREDWHDTEVKTILGKTGKFTGDDLIEITTNHQATAKRLAWRLCNEFLSDVAATKETIADLATWLFENKLDIGGAVQLILQSEVFFSNENLKHRIVEPESFIVGAARAFQMFDPPASTMVLADWNEQLGRKLFYPPNVGGWPGGRAWLNSRTTIARANFSVALANGNLNRSGVAPDFVALAEQNIGSTELADIAAVFSELLTGTRQDEQIKEVVGKGSKDSLDKNQIVRNIVALILASPCTQLG